MNNERFDRMMRGALAGIGTSQSFTRKLMLRLEKEKEEARAYRMRRIGIVAAIVISAFSLVSLVLLLTFFRAEETISVGILEGLKGKITLFFSDIFAAVTVSAVVNTVVVALAVFAVLSWDAVLGKMFSLKKDR